MLSRPAMKTTPTPSAADALMSAPPDPATLRQSARFWDKMARKYAAHSIADEAGYEASLRRTSELLAESDQVLEIGCGTGTTALRLAQRVRRLHATDVSAQMVAIPHEKLPATPIAHLDFAFLYAAGAVRYAPHAYDVGLACNVLHLLPD